LAERIVQVGSVTIHIPIRTEEQQKKYKERLAKFILQLWESYSPEQRIKFLNEYQVLEAHHHASISQEVLDDHN
jgi:hypothetical protein